jgi:hypothetical protein
MMTIRARTGLAVLFASAGLLACEDRPAQISDPLAGPTAANTISIFSGDNQTSAGSRQLPASIVAIVRDANNNPVPSIAVSFAVTAGGGSVTPLASRTDASGKIAANWTVGATGTQTATATISRGPSVSFKANIIPAGSKLFIITGNNQTGLPTDTLPTTLTVELRTASNAVIPGAIVDWSVEPGVNLGDERTPTSLTGSDGRAINRWILGWAKPTQTLKAKVAGIDSINFTGNVNVANLSWQIVSGDNQSASPGAVLPNKLVVRLTDALGNGIPGAVGTFAVTSGGGSITTKTTITTGADGRDSTSWALGSGGTQTATATIGAVGTLTFNATTATPTVGPGTHLYVVGGDNQKGTPLAALSAAPTVEVRDAANNLIPGATVEWSVEAGSDLGSVLSSSNTTGANGRAANSWTLGWATTNQTLKARIAGIDSVFFNASVDVANLQWQIVAGNGQTGGPGSTLPTKLTVQLKDLQGNSMTGAPGTWNVSGGGTISKSNLSIGANARDSVTWTLGPSGAQVVTATIGAVGTLTFNAGVGVPVGSKLSIVQGNNQKGTPGAALSTLPTVELRDPSNSVVAGATVEWSVESGANLGSVSSGSSTTGAGGQASTGWTLGWAKTTQTLKARVAGIDSITFTAAVDTARLRFTIVSGNNQSALAGATLPNRLVVQVSDTLNNAISGAVGTFAVAGGGSINKTALSMGVTGRDSVTWTIGTTGTQTVTATIGALGTVTFNATISAPTVGAGSHLFVVAGDNQKGLPTAPLAVLPTVELRDANNNLIPGAAIEWSVEAGSNLGSPASATVNTGNDGRASTTWTLGWAKATQKLRARIAGVDSVFFTGNVDVAKLRWQIVSGNNQSASASATLPAKLIVELKDTLGNAIVGGAGTFAVTSGGGLISKTAISTGAGAGRDSVAWTLGPAGTQTVTANIGAMGTLTFSATFAAPPPAGSTLCPVSAKSYELDMALGQSIRTAANAADVPTCLNFLKTRDAGRQYIVLFEDAPPFGDYTHGFLSGANDPNIFGFTISTAPPASTVEPPMFAPDAPVASQLDPQGGYAAWDGPSGTLSELRPEVLPDPVAMSSGRPIHTDEVSANLASSTMVTYNVGDTLSVFMQGIPRLVIPSGTYKAVVKKVTNNIVFAEDTRLTTVLYRENGTSLNTPLTETQMTNIATQYDSYGFVQNNLLFNNLYNAATAAAGNKVVLVHTLMPSNTTWGYTSANTNVILFDFWVSTADGRTPGLNQNPIRVADNLVTHEVAHQRHYALNSSTFLQGANGIPWVEGFARFTERGAIAHRTLATQNYSRTGNVTLPLIAGLETSTTFFMSDIPDYTKTPNSNFQGYDAFAYFFDYFSDQTASSGGDWRAAVRNLITNGNTLTGANNAIAAALPGSDLFAILTKSRLALYADEYTAGLPSSLQFTMLNLRGNRLSTTITTYDPRTTFLKVTPGVAFSKSLSLAAGAAQGYLIDGANASSVNAKINLSAQAYARGVVSVTRIR